MLARATPDQQLDWSVETTSCFQKIKDTLARATQLNHPVEGREFHICTDHKPLIYALDARPDRHTPRQIRHLDFIAQFTSDIRFVKGSENVVADALSRVTLNASQRQVPTVDFLALALAQQSDPDLQNSDTALDLRTVTLPPSNTPLICDVSTGNPRPFVPENFRHTIFLSLHQLSYPGIRATQKLITARYDTARYDTARYVWPVRRWTRACRQYQRAKVYRHTTAPLIPFPTPDAPDTP